MAKVPEDIQKNMKKLSEVSSTPLKDLMKKLKNIMETDEKIQTMKKEAFKIRYAWAKLYQQYAVTGNQQDLYIKPTITSSPREITTRKGEEMWLGELTGLIRRIDKNDEGKIEVSDDVEYASGMFFREGAEALQDLEKGKVYKTSLIVNDNSWGVEIGTGSRPKFQEADVDIPNMDNFYEKEIKDKDIEINIGDLDLNEKESSTDLRVLRATAFDCDIEERADGSKYGYYDLFDESNTGGNFRIFVEPTDVEWSQGSILIVGGTVDINPNDQSPIWNTHFILPTDIAEKREVVIEPAEEETETVDVSSEEESEETEETEESEEEESVFEI